MRMVVTLTSMRTFRIRIFLKPCVCLLFSDLYIHSSLSLILRYVLAFPCVAYLYTTFAGVGGSLGCWKENEWHSIG